MKFILYCRKSTDTEDKQVLSLASQEDELQKIVKANGLDVIAILKESKSAKEPGRPIFNDMIKMITAGKADAILCWKIDRLTRNPVDGGQIQWLLQNNQIKCIRTFDKSYYPNDNVIVMSIEQAMANQYIRDLSVNVKRGNRAKLERGEWPNQAPLGYLNDKTTKTVVVDKKYAPFITRAFELYATGTHTLKQTSDILYKEGLRTKTGNKIEKGQLQRLLLNRFYTGLMPRDGKIYPGKHTPIISQKLFDTVQDVLAGRNHPRPKKYFYAAQGFLKCASCGCALTVDTQRGHQYYYCTNGRGNCEEHKKYLKSDDVHALLSNLFLKLKFREELIEFSYDMYKEENKGKITYVENSTGTLTAELDDLLKKELTLADGYSSQLIREEVYKIKLQEIENKRVIIKKQIAEIQARGGVSPFTLEQIKEVLLEGNKAAETYLNYTEEEKRNMLGKVLSNASIKNQTVASAQFKSVYQVLATAPKNIDFRGMWAYHDSNVGPRHYQ